MKWPVERPWYEVPFRRTLAWSAMEKDNKVKWALKVPRRRAIKVPCGRALTVLCRRALIGPVEGCWTCLMFHFCSHDFVHSNVIVPVQLHVQMQLDISLPKKCNQLYSAHRMILATLLQCCQHDSGSSFIIILYLRCRNWNCSPVWLVDS